MLYEHRVKLRYPKMLLPDDLSCNLFLASSDVSHIRSMQFFPNKISSAKIEAPECKICKVKVCL